MSSEKKGNRNFGPGIEVLDDGIKMTGSVLGGGQRCICSPGGWAFGNTSDCGCSCGCFGTATPTVNNGANDRKSDT